MNDTFLICTNVTKKAQLISEKAFSTAVKDLLAMLPAYLVVAGVVTYLSLGWVL